MKNTGLALLVLLFIIVICSLTVFALVYSNNNRLARAYVNSNTIGAADAEKDTRGINVSFWSDLPASIASGVAGNIKAGASMPGHLMPLVIVSLGVILLLMIRKSVVE